MQKSLDKLKALVNAFNKNPLYHFSKSNTELFHSNFWYWLSTIDKKETLALFDPENIDEFEVDKPFVREKDNIDLQIITKNKLYIIENKIKSVAASNQLDSYYDKFEEERKRCKFKQEPRYMLVSPHKYDFLEKNKWNVLSYESFSSRIREFNLDKILEKDKIPYYKNILSDYSDLLSNITELINYFDEYIDDGHYFFLSITEEEKSLLESIKMYDVIMKIQAAYFAFNVYKKLINDSRVNDKYNIAKFNEKIDFTKKDYNGDIIFVNYSYSTNKGPVIDIFFPFEYFILKIQIEGNSYKYVFEHFNKEIFSRFNKISSYLKKENWLVKGEKGEGRDKSGINKYRNKEFGENFHYRYNVINGDECSNLCDIIIDEILYAINTVKPIINDIN